ncbi:hypothetical protein Tsubulata_020519 [Turnera subulata]|uniref:Amino acid transporter transmembrane domain-containing protein n=1 Tax=Turnera subulata TaxID=218843 RepID=A0A9Q0F0S0_9ROSI|nr:hypothetical protein Tsubulata_020519 [Turnera subulata]
MAALSMTWEAKSHYVTMTRIWHLKSSSPHSIVILFAGTVWTASAHIITAIIGSGVLSLAWGMAQLGWITGIGTLLVFSCITLYTSILLADCYRYPDPVTGKRNHTYMEAVRANLDLWVSPIHLHCWTVSGVYNYHRHEHGIPNLHKMSWLSVIAAIMSFGYASIGMGLSFAKIVSGKGARTSLTGVEVGMGLTVADKIWTMFRAIGDMVFACTYAEILIEIQDTLKSSPPESKVMKKASSVAILISTAFYMMCGCLGYAAFGNNAPGNMLTGFDEPFWLIDLANIFVVVHLLGAYQVLSQPVLNAFETWASTRWPKSKFVNKEYQITFGKNLKFGVNLLRLTWRPVYVIIVTVLAMVFPFFNDVLALLGAIGYWPMSVYFPVEMYISQKKIQRRTFSRLLPVPKSNFREKELHIQGCSQRLSGWNNVQILWFSPASHSQYDNSRLYDNSIHKHGIFVSQIPNFHKLSWLSIIAAIMSFSYATIGIGLAFAKVVSGHGETTTITGAEIGVDLTAVDKMWMMFTAIGDMAFACAYSLVLIEIQDTLKSSPPENKVMRKANRIAVLTSTGFYLMCGCFGYAAFGNHAPGNLLTGFGFYEPFWLVDLANICIVVHLVGAYQVLTQPVYSAFESWASIRWPNSKFVNAEYPLGIGNTQFRYRINFLRLAWRTTFVVIVTLIAMTFPFFNQILALLGALGYWPMVVYFPVAMYIAQHKISRYSLRWCVLQLLNLVCLLVTIAAASGAIQGLSKGVSSYKAFQFKE